MRYEVLGPLQVTEGGEIRRLHARKIETLLAVLVLTIDHLVPLERLLHELWGDDPPRRAKAALYVYISETRRFVDVSTSGTSRIVTDSGGYRLSRNGDVTDLQLFEAAVAEGRAFGRKRERGLAVKSFEHALSLFRGPILPALQNSPTVGRFVVTMEEARLECLEELINCQLHVGSTQGIIGRLLALIEENPFRESFYSQLMLALYRSNRRADALKIYDRARSAFREELGLDPGRSLQELHRAILRDDVVDDRWWVAAG